MLEKHGVNECKIEQEGEKITLKRNQGAQHIVTQAPIHNIVSTNPVEQLAQIDTAKQEQSVKEPESHLLDIASPMVGTFYRKPAVDAAPYVEVGDVIKKGDVLCIVEAMKLMNEIVSELSLIHI